ncbi:MAG: CHASE2 domain-containing protein [Thermoanaerobaculaceae bacterium]|nr:CHASE2 domain-containing protein [Thermoanaerobaculaceae bacterium]
MDSRYGRWRWLGAAGTAVLVAAWLGWGPADRLELPLRDLVLRALPERPARLVAVVAVDDTSIETLGPWPWSRARLADLVSAVRRASPRGVALDVLLVEPDPSDPALTAALAGSDALLVAALRADGGGWLLPSPGLQSAATAAHGAFELDHDGVLRRLAGTKQAGGLALPALSVALASRGASGLAVPVGRDIVPDFRTSPEGVPVTSAWALLDGSADAAALQGRLVLIGVTATGLGDRVVTPRSGRSHPSAGVLVHAAVTERLVAGGVLHPLPPLGSAVLAALLMLLAGLAARVGGLARLAAGVALVALPGAAGLPLLAWAGVSLPVATLTAVALLSVVTADALLALRAWRSTLASTHSLHPSGTPTGTPRQRLELLESLAAEAAERSVAEAEARRVAAHELKTPLTSLKGLAQLLRDYDLDTEEQRHVADLVHHEAERLHALVDTLLDLERLQLKDFEREARPVDLSRLAAERTEALARGGGREIRAEGDVTVTVRGVEPLLSRVVDNLVGNALKFAPPGLPVTVRVLRAADEAWLEVEDHGPGVAPDDRERIFTRFGRGASAAGQPGLGLGLALVSEVAAWHGGRVQLLDAPGGGSVFRVHLPIMP